MLELVPRINCSVSQGKAVKMITLLCFQFKYSDYSFATHCFTFHPLTSVIWVSFLSYTYWWRGKLCSWTFWILSCIVHQFSNPLKDATHFILHVRGSAFGKMLEKCPKIQNKWLLSLFRFICLCLLKKEEVGRRGNMQSEAEPARPAMLRACPVVTEICHLPV